MTNPQTGTTLLHPADVFTHLIITYLTPMFLATTGGDLQYARMAATEAVNAYAAREPIDLLSIAQIIAFGLAILDSLNRSMADNLPIALVLRLRGNAVSLGRVAERCRRALPDPSSSDTAASHPSPQFDPEAERQREAAVLANIARAEQRLAEVTASAPRQPAVPTTPKPHPAPKAEHPIQDMPQAACNAQRRVAQPGPAVSAPRQNTMNPAAPPQTPIRPVATPEGNAHRIAWAAAMIEVARETAADLANLPPAQHGAARTPAAALLRPT
jgi:hypothetical protein